MIRGRKPRKYNTCQCCGSLFERWRKGDGNWTLAEYCQQCRYQKRSPLWASVKKTREANRCATLQQIGDKYGVTKERVRQILSREQLPTRAIIERKIVYCLHCGKETPNLKFCSHECQQAYHSVEAVCSQCGRMFSLRQSELIARTKHNTTGLLFCSKQCYGKWFGTNYGRGCRTLVNRCI